MVGRTWLVINCSLFVITDSSMGVWLAYDKAYHRHVAVLKLTNWSINIELYNFRAAGACLYGGFDGPSSNLLELIGFITDCLQVLGQWSLLWSLSLLLFFSSLQSLRWASSCPCLFFLYRNLFKIGSQMRVSFHFYVAMLGNCSSHSCSPKWPPWPPLQALGRWISTHPLNPLLAYLILWFEIILSSFAWLLGFISCLHLLQSFFSVLCCCLLGWHTRCLKQCSST